jgi:hypothetical protein
MSPEPEQPNFGQPRSLDDKKPSPQKKEEKEQKGAGFIFWRGVALTAPKLAAGLLAIMVAGGGMVLFGLNNTTSKYVEHPRAIQRAEEKRQALAKKLATLNHSARKDDRKSSVELIKKENSLAPLPGARSSNATTSASANGTHASGGSLPSSNGQYDYGNNDNSRASKSTPKLKSKLGGRFAANSFGRGFTKRSTKSRKSRASGSSKKQHMGDVKSFGASGGKLADRRAEVGGHLASKNIGNNISASKTMGQLKFAGQRSRKASAGDGSNQSAAYAEQAFSQERRERTDIDDTRPMEGASETAAAGPGIAGEGEQYSTGTGQQVNFGGGGEQAFSCPAGMVPVSGGACEPRSVSGADATTYDRMVSNAWSLIRRARSATKRLDILTATKLSKRAEELGIQIGSVYGQDMQGDIIKFWADRSNELNHYHKAKKKAHEKRAQEMDPKLDEDVHRETRESRDAGFK